MKKKKKVVQILIAFAFPLVRPNNLSTKMKVSK